MKLMGHQRMEFAAEGRILAPGEGYQENDATKSTMDSALVEVLVAARRIEETTNMERRASQIERGLVHETVAAQRDRYRYRHERR